ncbi:probable WRKY transcription factor 46 [Punica granatum]|uniref:Probable WRKY transcription factor 46 n=1 Tax=Punica granatum TaxID=22663 RepID=A0A218W728_PUNGR|nr:probable WRKY transcription factor 46 [Punica granatum]OWM68664.1 hypothetical protein CDL15_Pgr023629 [Punica granatum]
MEAEQQVMMMGKWDPRTLMNELAQGKELAQQLKTHLAPPSSTERRRFLTERILGCYEKALSLLNCRDISGGSRDASESTVSFLQESPTSRVGDQFPRDVFKKRKTSTPRWTEEVRVVSGSGLDGPPDDGYNWRKYGQKDILGSKFPRGYYRCTHRHVQGCLATKQIQKSDHDPNVFEVVYRGRHTCSRSTHSVVQSQSRTSDGPRQEQDNGSRPRTFDQKLPNQSQPINFNFKSDLRLEPEEVDARDEMFPSFSFTDSAIESDQNIFATVLTDNNFLDSITIETPEPDYLQPMSLCHLSSLTSESDPHEIVSAPTSVTNSPIGDVIFPLEKIEFDPDLLLDDLQFSYEGSI